MKGKSIINLLKTTFSEWNKDNAARLAAALSYYATFSIPALLVVLIAVAGLIGRSSSAQLQIADYLQRVIGPQGKTFVQNIISARGISPSTGILATILGVITLLFGTLGIFGELRNALNTILGVEPKPTQGIIESFQRLATERLVSFLMVLGTGLLMLISLVLSAGMAALQSYMGNALPFSLVPLQYLNYIISYGIITLLIAIIFKFLPDAETSWHDLWRGAAVTSLLFSLGQILLSVYLGNSGVSTTFGKAGSLAALLIWIYYSTQILLFGAEFTKVYANQYGSKIKPSDNAVPVIRTSPKKQNPIEEADLQQNPRN
jgi:membrane protein